MLASIYAYMYLCMYLFIHVCIYVSNYTVFMDACIVPHKSVTLTAVSKFSKMAFSSLY